MKLFYDEIKDFDDLVIYFETNTSEDLRKSIAIGNLILRKALPIEYIKDKPLEVIKVQKEDKELNYSQFLRSISVGFYKTRFSELGSSTIYHNVKSLEKDINKYEKVYELLDDDLSKLTMFNILMFRLTSHPMYLNKIRVNDGYEYFRPELVEEKNDGVFLDYGGFDGNSSLDYIKVYGDKYKKIYIFEPEPKQYKVCLENTKNLENIVCINKGIGDTKEQLSFINTKGVANTISPNGDIKVDVIILDEEIKEPVTFIKMDIEGSEVVALKGCKNHIKNNMPNLTISLYHVLSDIYVIPILINRFNNNYKFNIRYHANAPAQYGLVLYAKPIK